jgi:hypothetical protein
MKSFFIVLIIFGDICLSFSQKQKSEKFEPTYSSCEVEGCGGSRILSLSDTTVLLAKMCNHQVGCSGFRQSGKWSTRDGVIRIEPAERVKVLADLKGKFYKVKRADFEILFHESAAADSIKILSEIENGFKETDLFKTFFVEYTTADKTREKEVRRKLLSEYIQTEFTWKYKILVRAVSR